MRIYGAGDLAWRGNRLCLGRKVLDVGVVPDAHYPGMWRVEAGGTLSDMVNRTRARDAARSAALAMLNGGTREAVGRAAGALKPARGTPR